MYYDQTMHFICASIARLADNYTEKLELLFMRLLFLMVLVFEKEWYKPSLLSVFYADGSGHQWCAANTPLKFFLALSLNHA